MHNWLNDEQRQKLLQDLNPHLNTGRTYDANWENLKQERVNPFDRTVKTQTPTLLQHERNYSFQYRRFDGAHWHTELREVDTEFKKTGLTKLQHRLKENIDTIMVLQNNPFKMQWITPTVKQSGDFDPVYQLIRLGTDWLCWQAGAVYAVSNSVQQPGKAYISHTFSTREKPVFTLEQTEAILDRLLK